LADSRNLLPVIAYALLIAVGLRSLLTLRIAGLVGISLFLVPLVPALNILFPVGTLLAERLLFTPSAGFTLVLADFLVNDLASLWMGWAGKVEAIFHPAQKYPHRLGDGGGPGSAAAVKRVVFASSDSDSLARSASGNRKKSNLIANTDPDADADADAGVARRRYLADWLLHLSLVWPLCALYGFRVVSRCSDWNSEISLYRSALEVCPLSVKALTNYGLLTMSEGRIVEAATLLKVALSAHKDQKAARVNLGLTEARRGDDEGAIRGVETFEVASQVCKMS
jgi:hypothetical protein